MKKVILALLVALAGLGSATSAMADGCQVLLCVAGDWKHIGVCVPPVEKALRDAALGRGWPSCSESGSGNNASYTRATPINCPEVYQIWNVRTEMVTGCKYTSVITLKVNGAWWSTIYGDNDGNSSTDYSADAKAKLGANYDPTYDYDVAHYRPPVFSGPER